MCDLDNRTILFDINQRVAAHGLQAMTTAAVVAYDGRRGEACVSYAGHPPVLARRTTERSWSPVVPREAMPESDHLHRDLPLAVVPDAVFGQVAIPMTSGDRLFIHTDGLTEAPSPGGEQFGSDRLREVLDANVGAPLSELRWSVIQALDRHTESKLTHDDVTIIALEISSPDA
jgi:sigma-B regulation protein RsbU (phosphoserine phosphatase)